MIHAFKRPLFLLKTYCPWKTKNKIKEIANQGLIPRSIVDIPNLPSNINVPVSTISLWMRLALIIRYAVIVARFIKSSKSFFGSERGVECKAIAAARNIAWRKIFARTMYSPCTQTGNILKWSTSSQESTMSITLLSATNLSIFFMTTYLHGLYHSRFFSQHGSKQRLF